MLCYFFNFFNFQDGGDGGPAVIDRFLMKCRVTGARLAGVIAFENLFHPVVVWKEAADGDFPELVGFQVIFHSRLNHWLRKRWFAGRAFLCPYVSKEIGNEISCSASLPHSSFVIERRQLHAKLSQCVEHLAVIRPVCSCT